MYDHLCYISAFVFLIAILKLRILPWRTSYGKGTWSVKFDIDSSLGETEFYNDSKEL